MSVLYKLLKNYKGFAKGQIITVAAPSRFEDMNNGYGELYIEPVPEKIESESEKISKPKIKQKRDSKGHFIKNK